MVNSTRFFLILLLLGTYQTASLAQFVPSKVRPKANEENALLNKQMAQPQPSKMQELSAQADLILTGKVAENKSSWNENKSRIFTTTTLRVNEYLKGNNGGTVAVITPGGEIGKVGELYSDVPKFDVNEDVLLFLKKDQKNNGYKILNGNEGKITIQNSANSAEAAQSSNMRINSIKAQIKNFMQSEK